MAQQTLIVGTVFGDGSAEDLKSSLVKCNSNFTELYGRPSIRHPGYKVGRWYTPFGLTFLSTGAAPGANSIRLFPSYAAQLLTIDTLGVRVTTLSGGGNVQAAIYAADANNMPTGASLIATASMSTGATVSVNSAAALQLNPDALYWFATNCDNAVAVFDSVPNTSVLASMLIGSTSPGEVLASGGSGMAGLSIAQTFGTWPNLTAQSFTSVFGSSSVPVVQFKVASVP